MASIEINVKLPVDDDGFIEYECPFCKQVFKLEKNLFKNEYKNEELFCPYCGLKSNVNRFYTTEFIEYLDSVKTSKVNELINKEMSNIAKKSKGLLTIKSKNKNIEPLMLKLHYDINNNHICKICNEKFKTNNSSKIIYCPYCGVIL